MPDHGLATHGLAGFGAANFQTVTAGGLAAKIVVEAQHAVDFGVGEVQGAGDERDGGFIDVAELVLQGVEDRQQATGQALEFLNARKRQILRPKPCFERSCVVPVTPYRSGRCNACKRTAH